MANEASAALSDAYGHVMHGDDAGSSAKVVWVVHPTKVPIDINIGDQEVLASSANKQQSLAANNKMRDKDGASAGVGSPGRNPMPSSYLFTQKFDLGLTFLEINDRAYVRTVDAGSMAEKAGIQSRDCVQFACVVGGPQFENQQTTTTTNMQGSGGRMDNTSQRENEKQSLDSKASKFVLECEQRGMRTSYEEMRDLFAGCTLAPKGDGNGSMVDNNKNEMLTPPRTGLPLAPSNNNKRATGNTDNDDNFTIGSNSLALADSVGGMFETTRKNNRNNNVSSRRGPILPDKTTAKNVTLNVTNAARHAIAGRCFDNGNDGEEASGEFGEDGRYHPNQYRSSNKQRSPILDTPTSPIRSDNGIHSPSSPSRRSGRTFGDSVVEQSLYPVVMVFRRTVQRKRALLGPSKGWGSPGLSLKGSLFGIPSFRMDDECDRAAALMRQLAPAKKSRTIVDSDMMFCATDCNDGDSTQAPTVGTSPGASERNEDIEASTIRGMIGSAVGLGFVRLSKVVVGVSLQGGSGIIISRLPDGTWSAPSAMGVYGLGVGLQFGLEVADFLFIIQTNEGMEHFKRGGNFVLGGNIGAAVVNCGREAYGAASLGTCTGRMPLDDPIDQDDAENDRDNDIASTFDESTYLSNASSRRSGQQQKKKDNDIAPMVAYAKSQGLYFGVSVDGLKFFTRNDINTRTYKFTMLSEMPAKDILSGLVLPPPEAEDLYSALHSVEYTHEMTELPRPPEMLRREMNDWRFDRSIAAVKGEIVDICSGKLGNFPPYSFLSTLNREEADRFAQFETKFKKFLYGGVAIQHLMPNSALTRSGMTRREKRTLWLMLPEVGSLRLGFVSKDNGGDASTMDDITVASSVASSRVDADDQTSLIDAGNNVKLSKKYSVSLTDITALSQDANVTIRLSPDDATEHLRVISLQDVTGKSMLFLANSNREAELLFCGLKLLLECETARLSVRGGVPLNKLGGKLGKGALSPVSARGSLKSLSNRRDRPEISKNRHIPRRGKDELLGDRSKYSSFGEPGTDSDEEATNAQKDLKFNEESEMAKLSDRHQVPEGRQSWSQLPGRNKMRQIASSATSPRGQTQATYELGKAVCTDIATNISLPLPLALCRVLFLDSSSPVNKSWETGRADSDYRHGAWAFPPGSVREFDRNSSSEQHLISRGSMIGAQRTISYSRIRNRELVRLEEWVFVEKDDDQSLVFVVTDQMPRRGFSARARLHLRSFGSQSCEARVVTEIMPVGKNLSNQHAVHKAFILVLDEMKKRYGVEEQGLLAVFLDVYNTLPGYGTPPSSLGNPASPGRSQAGSHSPNRKTQTSITSFKDVLPGNKVENTTATRPGNRSPSTRANAAPNVTPPSQKQDWPSTPSMQSNDSKTVGMPKLLPLQQNIPEDDFADFANLDDIPRNPVTVEVKPLPKIRLDLCPVPREEDEEEDGSVSVADAKQKRKSKHSKHKHRRSNRNR